MKLLPYEENHIRLIQLTLDLLSSQQGTTKIYVHDLETLWEISRIDKKMAGYFDEFLGILDEYVNYVEEGGSFPLVKNEKY